MPVRVPSGELDHLAGAPLKVVVAQVRYSPVHAVQRRDLVANFEAGLKDEYIAEDAHAAQTLTIQLGSQAPPPPLGPGTVDTVWPFRDAERGYVVSLGNSSLAVEADSTYHDFPQFLGEVREAVSACAEVFTPKRQLRVGLRYINEVEDARLARDVQEVVSADLTAPVGQAIEGGLIRSLAELRIAETLGVLVVRHGLVDTEKYLLDFDYFSEEERDFDPNAIVETLQGFHDLIEPFFIWSLNPDYLAELRGGRDAG